MFWLKRRLLLLGREAFVEFVTGGLLLGHDCTDFADDLFGECIGCRLVAAFAVNADNRFGIRFAQVHPFGGEIDFHAVDVGDLFSGMFRLHLCQNLVYVNIGRQFDLVL